jgi:hypothetical protein
VEELTSGPKNINNNLTRLIHHSRVALYRTAECEIRGAPMPFFRLGGTILYSIFGRRRCAVQVHAWRCSSTYGYTRRMGFGARRGGGDVVRVKYRVYSEARYVVLRTATRLNIFHHSLALSYQVLVLGRLKDAEWNSRVIGFSSRLQSQ